MADNKREKLGALKALRRRYPDIEISGFLRIVELVGTQGNLNDPGLHQLLTEENQRARDAEDARRARVSALVVQIRVSEMHYRIEVAPPDGVDLEHVQAILAYGLALPGSKGAFAGSHRLSISSVRQNVDRKLDERFDGSKFERAWSFLVGNGVIMEGAHNAFSFNPSPSRRGVTQTGKAIIVAMNKFLRDKV